MTIELTKKELKLLIVGLGAGIGDDGIENIGWSKRDMAAMGKVANRLHKLYDGSSPYFENITDY